MPENPNPLTIDNSVLISARDVAATVGMATSTQSWPPSSVT